MINKAPTVILPITGLAPVILITRIALIKILIPPFHTIKTDLIRRTAIQTPHLRTLLALPIWIKPRHTNLTHSHQRVNLETIGKVILIIRPTISANWIIIHTALITHLLITLQTIHRALHASTTPQKKPLHTKRAICASVTGTTSHHSLTGSSVAVTNLSRWVRSFIQIPPPHYKGSESICSNTPIAPIVPILRAIKGKNWPTNHVPQSRIHIKPRLTRITPRTCWRIQLAILLLLWRKLSASHVHVLSKCQNVSLIAFSAIFQIHIKNPAVLY